MNTAENLEVRSGRDVRQPAGRRAHFACVGFAEGSVEAADTARRILALREQHREAVSAGPGRAAGNGHRVLERLSEQPIVSVKAIQAQIGTTYQAANSLVDRMAALGILVEVTGQARNGLFQHMPYVRLFQDTSG